MAVWPCRTGGVYGVDGYGYNYIRTGNHPPTTPHPPPFNYLPGGILSIISCQIFHFESQAEQDLGFKLYRPNTISIGLIVGFPFANAEISSLNIFCHPWLFMDSIDFHSPLEEHYLDLPSYFSCSLFFLRYHA